MRFEGRGVIVTGGSAGIGRAACLAFAREGAAVAVVDLENAEAVAAEIAGAGGTAAPFTADVARAAEAVILFLASDDARYIHGAIVDVNGGLL